jgi:hypothetical protein
VGALPPPLPNNRLLPHDVVGPEIDGRKKHSPSLLLAQARRRES